MSIKKIMSFLTAVKIVAYMYAQTTPSHLHSTANSKYFYTDLSHKIIFKPYLLFKVNALRIKYKGESISLQPNSPTGIGLSFNCKYGGVSLGIGLPQSKQNLEKYGHTKRLDLRMILYRKNIGLDGHFQLYKGYYFENPQDFLEWKNPYLPQIPDMQSISIGASIFYVYNNEKYSNKAAVTRTQRQNKSAGSFLLGSFFNYDEFSSPNGFIPEELPDSIGNDFDLKAFRYIATGLNLGYAYTFVISKHFFLNASAISGGGFKDARVTNNSGQSDIERTFYGQLQLRFSLGYEHSQFFAGMSSSTLIRDMKYKNYNIDIATEQLRIFIGKRF